MTVANKVRRTSPPSASDETVGRSSPLGSTVIDGGVNHGLTDTSTHWEEFVGFTYLLPHRLWTKR